MKTKINLICLAFAMILLASCSGNSYKMDTIVNRDGSCNRTISFPVDSSEFAAKQLKGDKHTVKLDGDWKLSWQKLGKDSDSLVVEATQNFANVKAMAKATYFDLDGIKIRSAASYEKHFRWFYTDYEFTETYRGQTLNFPVSPSKYFTSEEMGYWFDGRPNLSEGLNGIEMDDVMDRLKEKYSNWLKANVFEMTYQVVIACYDQAGTGAVDKQQFIALHDSLQQHFLRVKDIMEVDAATLFRDFFHNDAYSPILKNDKLMAGVEKKQQLFMTLSSFTVDYHLCMDSHMSQGKAYRVTGPRLMFSDVTISQTERDTNLWAFAVTFLAIIIALVGLYKTSKRTR